MAIANSYPVGTVKTEDLILGTSIPLAGTNDKPVTKNFSVGGILALGNSPNIVTSTFTLTQAQLENLGTTSINLLTLASNQYLQLISASVEETFVGDIGSSYTWDVAGVTLAGTGLPDTGNNRITIPTLALPDAPSSIQKLYTTAALDGTWRAGSDLFISTVSNPVVVGTVTSATLTINLTYRIFQT